jgi:hypothetical protein
MDSARKAREVKTPVKLTIKTVRLQGSKLMAKIESASLPEDQEITPAFLKRPETEAMIGELPTSEDVLGIVDQIRALKLKKTEEFVKKFDQLEQIVTEIETMNSENKEEILATVTKALRAGVGFCSSRSEPLTSKSSSKKLAGFRMAPS